MTQLATRATSSGALAPLPIDDGMSMRQIAEACAKSGFFADTREAGQALVKIQAGHELGIPPIAAMTGIHIIKNKVSLGATMMGALVQRSKVYDYRIREHTDAICRIEWFKGAESLGFTQCTVADATRAGLAANDNYRKYPRAMLFSRAMSAGVRAYCPGVLAGQPVYTPDELGADMDADGNVRAPEARPAAMSATGGVAALNAAITGKADRTAKDPDPFGTEPQPGEDRIAVVATTEADVAADAGRAPTTAEKIAFANTLRAWSVLPKSEDGDACRRFAAKHGVDITAATVGHLAKLTALVGDYTRDGVDWFAVMNQPDQA